MGEFISMDEVREANRELGHHFFDKETIRFFGSRVGSKLYGGRFFVTSELDFYRTDRRYSVRFVEDDGSVSTTVDFREYGSWREAHAAARKAARDWRSNGEI